MPGRRKLKLSKASLMKHFPLHPAVKNTKKAFKNAVTRIIRKGTETKYVAEQILDVWSAPSIPAVYTNFNSAINTSADWYRCLPLLTQGENSHQRIGNQVSPLSVKVHLNFRFSPTAQDSNSRDIYVVVYAGKPKQIGAYSGPSVNSVWPTNFKDYLDNGDGTETFFGGNWTDAVKKIATDNFTLKAKRLIHLYKPSGVQNTNSGLTSVTSAPAIYNASTTITFKKMKNLKYENGSATIPTNFAHCWAAGYYYNDGTSADTGGGLLQVSARLEMSYKDD